MTKKEEKAIAVREAKMSAYVRKVDTLTGHVARRVKLSAKVAAFDSGKTAEAFAAEIATAEPVGQALHAAKADAVSDAGSDARQYADKVREDLLAHGWDINAAAPYPWRKDGYAADAARHKHNTYSRLTQSDPAKGYQRNGMNNEPRFVVMSDTGVARFVEDAERNAALYYDAFIVKMVAKVGECDSAEISGSHVWSHSILTVTKGASVERWKTQQIVNTSKLGLRFPQWPSRLMK